MHKALSPLPPPFFCLGAAYNRKHVHGKGFVASTQAFNFAFTRQFYNVEKNGKAARRACSWKALDGLQAMSGGEEKMKVSERRKE